MELNHEYEKYEKYNIIDLSDSKNSIFQNINQQWTDVHHSRNQDWMYWAILGAFIAGIVAVFANQNNFKNMYLFIFIINMLFTVCGIISFWAASISWSHWVLHVRKLEYIHWLENLFYLKYGGKKISMNPRKIIQSEILKNKKIRIVNGLIYSMYITIGVFCVLSLLITNLYYLFSIQIPVEIKTKILISLPLLIFIFGIIFLFTFYKFISKQIEKIKIDINKSYKNYIEDKLK